MNQLGRNIWLRPNIPIYDNAKYYVRAFATNFSGTAYGRQIMATTMSSVNFNNNTQRSEMLAVPRIIIIRQQITNFLKLFSF